jgi:hypothetical protein
MIAEIQLVWELLDYLQNLYVSIEINLSFQG